MRIQQDQGGRAVSTGLIVVVEGAGDQASFRPVPKRSPSRRRSEGMPAPGDQAPDCKQGYDPGGISRLRCTGAGDLAEVVRCEDIRDVALRCFASPE
jgi:hypothetical protein